MKLLLSILISFGTFASNGNGVGNGGDVVVCKNSIELLDFTEAKILKSFKLDEGSGTYFVLAKARLEYLKPLDEKLYKQYSNILKVINKDIKFLDGVNFRDVPDSFEIAIPQDCKLEQIAIQDQASVHVSRALWSKLDEQNKAGLILHEIIYSHFKLLGETNSVKVRKFNAFLFSKEIKTMKKADYQKWTRDLGLKLY